MRSGIMNMEKMLQYFFLAFSFYKYCLPNFCFVSSKYLTLYSMPWLSHLLHILPVLQSVTHNPLLFFVSDPVLSQLHADPRGDGAGGGA